MGIRAGMVLAAAAAAGGCAAQSTSVSAERASVSEAMTLTSPPHDPVFVIALGAGDEAGRMVHAHALATDAYPNGHLMRRQAPVLADGPSPLESQSSPVAGQQIAEKTVQRSG